MEWFPRYIIKWKEQNIRVSIVYYPSLKKDVRKNISALLCQKKHSKDKLETNKIDYMRWVKTEQKND